MIAPPRLLATEENIAVPQSVLLAARLGQQPFFPTLPPQSAGNTSLPVLAGSGDTMIPGRLYPSSGDASHQLYLPAYQITAMSLVPAADAASGTVNVTLTAPAPAAAAGQTVAVVPHVLRAQLVYSLTNESGNPTVTIRRDFDPVSVPGSPLVLTIGSAGELGQVALALGKQKVAWSTALVLTADMQVAVPPPRVIFPSPVLAGVLKIDPARLAAIANSGAVATAAPPAATSVAPRLAASPVTTIATTPAVARTMAMPLLRPINMPGPAGDPPPPLRPPVSQPAPIAHPGLPVHFPLPQPQPTPTPVTPIRFPILNPPAPVPRPVNPPTLVTIPSEVVESLSLAGVTVNVPIDRVTLPANTNLLRVDCDGVDLWVDQTPPQQFYYLPQAFCLGLAPASDGGIVPTLLVSFDTGDGSSAANVGTELTMQLRPHIDARDLARARSKAAGYLSSHGLAGPPRLSVQEPPVTQLEWWVPSASGPDQSQAAAVPATARASFEQGVSATVSMTYPQFQQIVDRFLVPWSPGLQGAVMYQSPEDATLTQSVPIRVNLRELEGTALTVSAVQVDGDTAQLTLANQIGCDVVVDGVTTTSGVELTLRSTSGTPIPGCRVPAGASLTVTATGANGAALTPSDVEMAWHADPTSNQLVSLCASFIGNQPATPDPVSLTVETLPGFFRSGVQAKALAKLRVQFTDDDPAVQVELTHDAPAATARLIPSLLLSLLHDPGASRFTYKVTNVYADRSTTDGPPLTWDGGSPLVVEANPPEGPDHAAT